MIEKFIHNYKGFGDCNSECGIIIWYNGVEAIVLMIELKYNKGTSITNMSEQIAQKILINYNLDFNNTRFFETYIDGDDRIDSIEYDIVDGKLEKPKWSHCELIIFKELLKIAFNYNFELDIMQCFE